MNKANKTIYSCTECGSTFPKWAGKCSGCGQWNTLVESVKSATESQARFSSWTGSSSKPQKFSEMTQSSEGPRYKTGLEEFDRVLGGGLTKGSVVLIGGDPGVGKSTLILQACAEISKQAKVLYFTGEESPSQVLSRAQRLGLEGCELLLASEIECEKIMAEATSQKADVIVVDSIQTVFSGILESAPGSVSQVRECGAMLTRLAKSQQISIFLVGHVTKEGTIAGPRVLEHIVDTVLSFEGDSNNSFRIIRALKNRFGGANEMGIFSMEEQGLAEVSNPSELFISPHESSVSGSVIHAAMEGSRPFLIEVQALVEDSPNPNPKRHANGFDTSRLQLLLAILNKHGKSLQTYDKNVYLKVVGGVRLNEPAADLSALIAVYSSLKREPIPQKLAAFGEVGLAGEIRPVQHVDTRLIEASKLGYDTVIIPASSKIKKGHEGLCIKKVKDISELLAVLKDLS